MGQIRFEKKDKCGDEFDFVELLSLFLLINGMFLASAWIIEDEFGWELLKECVLLIELVIIVVLSIWKLLDCIPRFRWLAKAGFLLLGSMFLIPNQVLLHMETLYRGFRSLGWEYLNAWNQYYKSNFILWDMTETDVDTGTMRYAYSTIMLFVIVFLIVVILISWKKILIMLLPIGVLALGLLVNHKPSVRGILVLIVSITLLFHGEADRRQRFYCEKRQSEWKRYGQLLATVLVGAIVGVSCLILAKIPAERLIDQKETFWAIERNLEDRVVEQAYGIAEHFGAIGQDRVDNHQPEYRDQPIVTITLSKRPVACDNIYLKDYQAGRYQKGHWRRIADPKDTTKFSYDAVTHLSDVIEGKTSFIPGDEVEMTLNYQIIGSQALVPYFSDLSDTDMSIDHYGIVRKSLLEDELHTKMWVMKDFWLNEDYVTNPEYQFCMWGFEESENEAAKRMKSLDPEYSAYVKKTYTNNEPEDYIASAVNEIEKSVQKENAESDNTILVNRYRAQVAFYVKKYLSKKSYNLYLDELPSGTDPVAYFLETGKEGYCTHFASAGTLLLQALHIPARYATGYIVKSNSFIAGSEMGYTSQVTDRNGHAWVEIYLENIGWVPYEMTPGYDDVSSDLMTDDSQNLELKKKHERHVQEREKKIPDTQSTEEIRTTQEENTQKKQERHDIPVSNETQTTPAVWIKLRGIAIVVGGLLFLVSAVILCGRYYRLIPERLYRRHRYRELIICVNRRIYRRVYGMRVGNRRMKFQRNSLGKPFRLIDRTDREYEIDLMTRYQMLPKAELQRFMKIVRQAAFSPDEIKEEDAAFCLKLYQL